MFSGRALDKYSVGIVLISRPFKYSPVLLRSHITQPPVLAPEPSGVPQFGMSDYLTALWQHWVSLMSGVVGILVGLGLRAGRLVSPTISTWADVPDWAFIVVGVLALFCAGFLAWKDEHIKWQALAERLRTRELRLEEEGTSEWWGTRESDKRFMLVVGGALSNPHGPPSAVINWRMQLEFPARTIVGETPLPSGSDILIPLQGKPGQQIILKQDHYWPDRTTDPIQPGGTAAGWFLSFFKDVSSDDIYATKPTVVLSCTDVVSRKDHSFRIRIGDHARGIRIPGE